MSRWDGESMPEEVMTAGGPTFPALVDEGKTVGVRAFTIFQEARESHRAGGARLLVLAAEREVDYLRKKFPMGMLAKVELGRMGIDIEELTLLTAEGVAGGDFPRSPEAFAKLNETTRGHWHEAAVKIGAALDGIVETVREVQDWISAHAKDRNHGEIAAASVVIATGGLSIPKIGATDLGYRIAKQFDLQIVEPRPGLVPLTFDGPSWEAFVPLAGISLEVEVSTGGSGKGKGKAQRGHFREDLLFTHRGLSGPAVLQISSYWREGTPLAVNLAPSIWTSVFDSGAKLLHFSRDPMFLVSGTHMLCVNA
jgi:hypothetical protein